MRLDPTNPSLLRISHPLFVYLSVQIIKYNEFHSGILSMYVLKDSWPRCFQCKNRRLIPPMITKFRIIVFLLYIVKTSSSILCCCKSVIKGCYPRYEWLQMEFRAVVLFPFMVNPHSPSNYLVYKDVFNLKVYHPNPFTS